MHFSKFNQLRRSLPAFVIAVGILLIGPVMFRATAAQPEGEAPPSEAKKEAGQLRHELEKLQAMNDQLREENRQLRRLLTQLVEPTSTLRVITPTGQPGTNPTAETNPPSDPVPATSTAATNLHASTSVTPPATASSKKEAPAGDSAQVHWLSATGKRHNATCRYFKYPGGTACGPTEGAPCRLCGG